MSPTWAFGPRCPHTHTHTLTPTWAIESRILNPWVLHYYVQVRQSQMVFPSLLTSRRRSKYHPVLAWLHARLLASHYVHVCAWKGVGVVSKNLELKPMLAHWQIRFYISGGRYRYGNSVLVIGVQLHITSPAGARGYCCHKMCLHHTHRDTHGLSRTTVRHMTFTALGFL